MEERIPDFGRNSLWCLQHLAIVGHLHSNNNYLMELSASAFTGQWRQALVSGKIKQYFLYGSISISMQLCIVFDHVASPHRYQQDRKCEARSVGISAMISPCLGFRLDLDKCIDTTTRLSNVYTVSKICRVNLHLFCKVATWRTVDSLYILYRVSLHTILELF